MKAFLLGIAVLVAGCGGSNPKPVAAPAAAAAPPPAAPPPDASNATHTVAMIAKFRDRMCACTDKACADTVVNEMTQWGQAESDRIAKTGDTKISEEDTKQVAALVEQMTQCMTKVMNVGSAS